MAPPPEKLPDSLVDYITSLNLLPQNAVWHPLQGGQTNLLWRLCGDGAAIVVKLFNASGATPLFPNDPAQEAILLRHLDPQGLAPALLHSGQCAAGAVLVYAHQAGTPWQADTARVGRLLKRLHNTIPPSDLRRIDGGSAMIEAQVAHMWGGLDATLQQQLRHLKPHNTVTRSIQSCLLHGDPVPGNILIGGDQAQDILIDWQCPGIGDPVEDLALFLSPAMQQIYRGRALSPAERTEFLIGYDAPTLHDRIAMMAPWHYWRMTAYCGWKAAQGSADYAAALPLELKALQACADRMQSGQMQ